MCEADFYTHVCRRFSPALLSQPRSTAEGARKPLSCSLLISVFLAFNLLRPMTSPLRQDKGIRVTSSTFHSTQRSCKAFALRIVTLGGQRHAVLVQYAFPSSPRRRTLTLSTRKTLSTLALVPGTREHVGQQKTCYEVQ